jgi:hypothetical protein
MTPGPVFLALGAVLAAGAWMAGHWPNRLLCAYTALPCLALSAAYFLRAPGVFLKRPGGRLPALSWLLFGAYHLANTLVLNCHRWLERKDPWHEIVPGLFVGERPRRTDAGFWISRRGAGVLHFLDLTAELPEPAWVGREARYLCLPTLDRTAPNPGDLKKEIAFIQDGLSEGVVLVHCAFGHSRSTLCVAAYLVASGRCRNAQEAWDVVQAKRPGAHLNWAQRVCLEQATL